MGAKPKVGFIIPFRDREAHLAQFTKRISDHSRGKYGFDVNVKLSSVCT